MDIAVTLSGGGTRLYGHLGVLEALEIRGFRIRKILGVSAGALVAALYASFGLDQTRQLLKTFDAKKVLRWNWGQRWGFFNNDEIARYAREVGVNWHTANRSGVELSIGVTALEPGIPLIWTPRNTPAGVDLPLAVQMSASIPLVWGYHKLPAKDIQWPSMPPDVVLPEVVTIVDGGCSVMMLPEGGLPLVASNIAFNGYRAHPFTGLVDYTAQLLAVYQYRTMEQAIKDAELIIKHQKMRATGWLDVFGPEEIQAIINDARRETLEALTEAKLNGS
jgi:hypothetical protein